MIDRMPEEDSSRRSDRERVLKAFKYSRIREKPLGRSGKLTVILYLFEEMTFEEIGLILDTTEAAARALYATTLDQIDE